MIVRYCLGAVGVEKRWYGLLFRCACDASWERRAFLTNLGCPRDQAMDGLIMPAENDAKYLLRTDLSYVGAVAGGSDDIIYRNLLLRCA